MGVEDDGVQIFILSKAVATREQTPSSLPVLMLPALFCYHHSVNLHARAFSRFRGHKRLLLVAALRDSPGEQKGQRKDECTGS